MVDEILTQFIFAEAGATRMDGVDAVEGESSYEKVTRYRPLVGGADVLVACLPDESYTVVHNLHLLGKLLDRAGYLKSVWSVPIDVWARFERFQYSQKSQAVR